MASDTKTPVEVARELAKALGEKLDGLKKTEKSEFSQADLAVALRKAVAERIDVLKDELVKMEQREAAGNAALLKKNIGNLPSSTPSHKQIADGDANNMRTSSVFNAVKKGEGVLPNDKKQKVVEAEGSGGQVTKGKLAKEAMGMSTPKAPKPPQAAGAKPTMHKEERPEVVPQNSAADKKFRADNKAATAAGKKGVPVKPGDGVAKMDLPQSPEKANGGQMTAKMELPQTSEKANGGQMSKQEMLAALDKAYISPSYKFGPSKPVAKPAAPAPKPEEKPAEAKKMELPQTSEKASGGQMNTKKMELPQTSEKANGGQMKKEEMAMAKALHPSPVFNVKPRLGGKDLASQHMTQQASAAGAKAPAAAASPVAKLPSVEEHAQRAAGFSDFMPKGNFSKAELDTMKCPGCKDGMTVCKCK